MELLGVHYIALHGSLEAIEHSTAVSHHRQGLSQLNRDWNLSELQT